MAIMVRATDRDLARALHRNAGGHEAFPPGGREAGGRTRRSSSSPSAMARTKAAAEGRGSRSGSRLVKDRQPNSWANSRMRNRWARLTRMLERAFLGGRDEAVYWDT